jgi:hypothetical protein
VGYLQDTTGYHGFLTDDVSFTTLTILDVPGPTETTANGVNDAGEIVGTFVPHLGSPQGFLAIPQVIPVITVSANPATLLPPNGRLIPVTVSGAITDEPGGSGINASSAAYRVMDEYGRVQPSGRVTLGTDGRYAYTVALQASREGDDRDGRRYVIVVSATDNGGNVGGASATVTVPRN